MTGNSRRMTSNLTKHQTTQSCDRDGILIRLHLAINTEGNCDELMRVSESDHEAATERRMRSVSPHTILAIPAMSNHHADNKHSVSPENCVIGTDWQIYGGKWRLSCQHDNCLDVARKWERMTRRFKRRSPQSNVT